MIYVTGDTHGDINCFAERGLNRLKKGDKLIITGDFGFIWDNSKEEQKAIKKLSKKKFEILFVEGIHENFELLSSYEEVDFYSGKAKKIAENVYCLNRGELYLIDDKVIFTLGGGVEPEAEGSSNTLSMPADEELGYAMANIDEQNRRLDLIITHEAPASVKRQIDKNAEINDLNIFLDSVLRNTRYGEWYFGSLHQDYRLTENLICVFEDVHKVK